MRAIINHAIEQLCDAFERGGYNPTPIIDLGVLVASADGTVDQSERDLLLDVFQTLLGTTLTSEVVDHLVTSSLEVAEAAGPEPRARLIAEILRDCEAVEHGLLVALAIAFASEGFSSAERAVIERIAHAADLPSQRLEELIAKVSAHAEAGPNSVRDLLAEGVKREA
jgi:tellurite resistance protein